VYIVIWGRGNGKPSARLINWEWRLGTQIVRAGGNWEWSVQVERGLVEGRRNCVGTVIG